MSTQNSSWAPPVSLLGVPFDHITTRQTLAAFESMIASRRPHYVATANVDFTVQAMHDVELRRILNDAHLILCDGTPLVWASRILGNPLPERVAGSDLVPKLLEQAEQRGHRIFFLGGEEEVLKEAVEKIKITHPKIQIAGALSPKFAPLLEMDHEAICKTIGDSKADILLVAFGCPKQEKWIAMNYRKLGVPVCIGVGATIDFLAGKVKRAPQWMRVCGLEWTFRLAQEPRRLFKRYFNDLIAFSIGITRQILALRPHGTTEERQMNSSETKMTNMVTLPEQFDAEAIVLNRHHWQPAFQGNKPVIIDCSRVFHIDSSAVALLSRMQASLRAAGHGLVLAAESPVLKNALRVTGMEGLFMTASSVKEGLVLLFEKMGTQTVGTYSETQENEITVTWQGEVTAANAPEVWIQTEAAMTSTHQGCGRMVVDLSRIQFVDSSGVALMVKTLKQGRARGLSVSFRSPSEAARNVVRILRLEKLLFSEPSNLQAA